MLLKSVYEIDIDGYVQEIYVVEFHEDGNCMEELSENVITIQPPNGLYRAKWNGVEWIEDMAQEEIETLNNQPKEPNAEDYLLDLDFRVSMVELGLI